MTHFSKLIEEGIAEKYLINMSNFFFVVVDDDQKWVNENINGKIAINKNSKTGFVVSPELFASVSVEQTIEEDKGTQMNTKFFEKLDDAVSWLEV